MSDSGFSYRNFLDLPESLPADVPAIRAEMPRKKVMKRYVTVGAASAVSVVMAAVLAIFVPWPLNLLGAAASLVGYFIYLRATTLSNCRWIEFEGKTIRARHIYTGRIVERSLDDIECVDTVVSNHDPQSQDPADSLGELFGVKISFRDGKTPMRYRWDDTTDTVGQQLFAVMVYRMTQLRELDSQIDVVKPFRLLRRIWWKGEHPRGTPGMGLPVIRGLLSFFIFMIGAFLGNMARENQVRHEIGSVPAQELTVRELIRNGYGMNRHVALTDYKAGNYALETKNGHWQAVWVPLFPAKPEPGDAQEIQVVLEIKGVGNEAALSAIIDAGRVTGICAESMRTKVYGARTDKLIKANGNLPLTSAWEVDEMHLVPTTDDVRRLMLASAACFSIVLIAGVAVIIRGVRENFGNVPVAAN